MRRTRWVSGVAAAALLATIVSVALAGKGDTILISRTAAGDGADDASFEPVASGNGRLVAYISQAENLSGADGADTGDIWVFNARTKRVELVSRNSGPTGTGGNGNSTDPAISPNGRYVVFASSSQNFPGGTSSGIYLYDRKRKRVRLVSRSKAGVAGNDDSGQPRISANGRIVAFISSADNLSGADVVESPDIYAYDRRTGKVSLMSRKSGRGPGGDDYSQGGVAVSASGRFVAFGSSAENLSGADVDSADDVFVYDRRRDRIELVSRESGGGPGGDLSSQDPSISGSGRYVTFQSGGRNFSGADLDAVSDIFAYDRERDVIKLVSREQNDGPGGDATSGLPRISADGRFIAFSSSANNLPGDYLTTEQNIFRYDYLGR